MTTNISRQPSGVPAGGQFAVSERNEARAKLSPFDPYGDPHAHFANQTDESGLSIMGAVYSILYERETIPDDYLVGRLSDTDIEAEYVKFIGPAIDELETNYVNVGDDVSPTTDDWQHLKNACQAAGLESMEEFYSVLADRDIMTAQSAANLSADTVARDYESHVEPAIDRLETSVGSAYAREAVDDLSDDLNRIGERVAASGGDVERYREDLATAEREFFRCGGGSQALRDYADRLVEAMPDDAMCAEMRTVVTSLVVAAENIAAASS